MFLCLSFFADLNNIPPDLPSDIVKMDLSSNSIKHLRPKQFLLSKDLKLLNLSSNNLHRIDTGNTTAPTFYSCQKLKYNFNSTFTSARGCNINLRVCEMINTIRVEKHIHQRIVMPKALQKHLKWVKCYYMTSTSTIWDSYIYWCVSLEKYSLRLAVLSLLTPGNMQRYSWNVTHLTTRITEYTTLNTKWRSRKGFRSFIGETQDNLVFKGSILLKQNICSEY